MKALQTRVHDLETQLVEMNSEPWMENPSHAGKWNQEQQTKHFGRCFGEQNLWKIICASLELGR